MHPLHVGDAIRTKDSDLAGTVEYVTDSHIKCRMKKSGLLVPYRREDLIHVPHAFRHGRVDELR